MSIDFKERCPFEDGYIDCDELTRSNCQSLVDNKKYIPFSMYIENKIPKVLNLSTMTVNKRPDFLEFNISFEAEWLFNNLIELGYACLEDFINFHSNTDIIQLRNLCDYNGVEYKLEPIK